MLWRWREQLKVDGVDQIEKQVEVGKRQIQTSEPVDPKQKVGSLVYLKWNKLCVVAGLFTSKPLSEMVRGAESAVVPTQVSV